MYTKVIRQIRYDNPQGLWAIDCKTGRSRIDELLDYCREIRTNRELYKFLGMSGSHSRDYYLGPLIKQGKLRLIAKPRANCTNQFYLNVEVDVPTNLGSAICFYCRRPRHLRDVVRHFGITIEQFTEIATPLIESGKLLGKIDNLFSKEKKGTSYKARYFISQLAMQKKGNAILAFCKMPRTRPEIQEFMGTTSEYYIQYLQPLIDSGKLALTKPDQLYSIDQMYIATDSLDENIKVLSIASVQEYCKLPKTRQEIAQHFEVKDYIASRFIEKMYENGLLKKTNELYPAAQLNGYVHPETDVIILSEASLIDFCKTPRRTIGIRKHFGISTNMIMSQYLQPLIQAGKIFPTRPQGSHSRKFTSVPVE